MTILPKLGDDEDALPIYTYPAAVPAVIERQTAMPKPADIVQHATADLAKELL